MNTNQRNIFLLIGSAFLTIIILFGPNTAIQAQPQIADATPFSVSREQLRLLVPDEQDLPGFIRVRPAGDTWHHLHSDPEQDGVSVNVDLSKQPDNGLNQGEISRLSRGLYSQDGMRWIVIEVKVCDSEDTARNEIALFRHTVQAVYEKGSFNDRAVIGDEIWHISNSCGNALIFRSGRMTAFIESGLSNDAAKAGAQDMVPADAIQAIAYQILLRGSQQAKLTDISAQDAHVAVNGKRMPKNSLLVGKQVYVPVQEFAKAMGLTSQWDTKSGALTLSGPKHKTITLTAGSTQASVGGVKAAALTVPVLKDAGQPVMMLDDLLTLTGGRVTGHVGNTVQVKG